MKKIFDIGANVGKFTEECFLRFPDCEVVCVEPNPQLITILNSKFENKNVIVVDKVVSTKNNDEIDFYLSNANTISTASIDWIENSRFSKEYRWDNIIKKETINLDELINLYGTPDLIKIDVEGYEYEVILGLSKKQKDICFEWAEEQYENINKTCEYLKKIGYEHFGVLEGDEYLKKPNFFTSWEESQLHSEIKNNRKEKWGMIWVK